jgi:hypothetical protein
MKKLLMLLFLMTISLGQSQTLRLGFESGESGNANNSFGGFSISPVEAGTGTNTSLVLPIVANAGGQIWQGTNFVLTTPVELIASKTMTIDVLSSTPVTFLMKVNGGVAGALEAAAQASHNGDGTWQTISFTFNTSLDGKAATANGVYNNMVIHPFFPFSGGPSAQTFYIDNISGPAVTPPSGNCFNGIQDGTETGIDCGGSCTACPPFTVAAPTPTQLAADVISVFSNAYTDLAGTDFYPNWGQSTQFSQFSPVVGNPTLKYSNLNYQGNQFASPIDASAMQNLHIDIWTPDCTSFQVYLISPGSESPVTLTPTLSGWNSYDIPLSSYPAVNKANLIQFKYVGSGTVYLDNIFFWKAPAGSESYYVDADGDGFGAGAATVSSTPIAGSVTNATDCNDSSSISYPGATEIADGLDNDCDGSVDEGFPPTAGSPFTPPARNAWDVVSIFSEAYSNVILDELPTSWSGLNSPFSVETIGGNPTWKFDGEFLGIVTNYGSGINLTDMTTMHIDYWTPDNKIMIAKIVNTVDGFSEGLTIVQDPVVTGTWRSVDIPMSLFGGSVNKSKITQILLDPQSGGSTVYVDNFYFYRPATGAPSPSIGALTVPAKVVGDANFELTAPSSNSAGAFTYSSSNESVAQISGTTVTIVGAGSTIITATQAAAGAYGAGSTSATLVVSLATAAPTPTIPADRVLSIFSDAAGYSNVAGTQFYPNWGQSTQYALESVAGNPTLRYSNLNYQGIQLGSVIDISTYNNIHLNIYGAGTSAVDFRVINQVGGAGSPDVERVANTAITLNPGWNSVVIPVSSLTTATPGFELNRVGQLMFVGSGTIYVDNIFFSKAVPTPVAPTVVNTSFCKGLGVALTATPSGNNQLKWYTVATKGTALATAPIPTATKTYYVSQVMSSGVESSRATIIATMNDLPTTPAVALTLGTEVIKKVGNLIGTSTALTLTATPVGAVTTASYNWTLPTNVTQVSGGSSAVITVNFAAVAPGNTALDFFVSSVSNNGCISKTAKKLTVTRAEPAKPKALVLTDALRPELLKITKLGEYTGALNTRTLTLTATPVDKQGSQATSYKWVLPAGVTTTATATTANTYTSTLPTIAITLAGVTNQASFLFQVYAVNGNGTSLLSKDLTCSSAAPKTPGAITTPALAKPTYNTTCNNSITVQVPAVLGATYNWSVSGGAVITSGQGSNVIAINTSAASATLTISVTASNGTGTSLPKVLLLKKATTCKVEATDNVVADDQLTVIAFPNPSSDEFTIESSRKGASVQVYDMLGRLIENRQATSNSVQVGRNYATGVYNVVVSQGNKAKTLKVIIIPIMYIF